MEIRIPKEDSNKIMGLLMEIHRTHPDRVDDLLQLTRSVRHGITVTIEPLTFERTRPQEKYYRKWCGEFAKFTGNTPNEMHDEILSICFGSDTVSTPFGWCRRPHKRSADAHRTDYSELIETLIRVASGFGFIVPPPSKQNNGDTDEWNDYGSQ